MGYVGEDISKSRTSHYSFAAGLVAFCTSSKTRSAVPLYSLVLHRKEALCRDSQLTTMIDTQTQNAHSNVQQAPPTYPSPPQSLAHPSSTLYSQISALGPALHHGYKLTSQPNIPTNNLQILRPAQLRTQLTTSLHDILPKLFVPYITPIIFFSRSSEDYTAAQRSWEYVCGRWVDAFRAPDVPMITQTHVLVSPIKRKGNLGQGTKDHAPYFRSYSYILGIGVLGSATRIVWPRVG
jgi:hypothetical protein